MKILSKKLKIRRGRNALQPGGVVLYCPYMKTVVLASSNKGKIKEIKQMLGEKINVLSAAEAGFEGDVEETGASFYENALIKARAVYAAAALPVIADDGGLEVDFLGGAPGVFSARYAGEHGNDARNRALLLKNMQSADTRTARFKCCLVYYDGVNIVSAEGATEGEILREERGEKGFGYDSVFYSYDLEKSFGEAGDDEKNSVSHRGRALRLLKEKLGWNG